MGTFAESSSTSTSTSTSSTSQMYWPKCEEKPYGVIKEVRIIVPQKVVQVVFTDNDVQKAVCNSEDDFSLERGIEVCLCKHYIGGTKAFNKQLRRGIKCYIDARNAKIEKEIEQERIAHKRMKRAEQKQRRAVRREKEERERQIEIQTEAILRANDIMGARAKRERAREMNNIRETET